MAVVNGVLDKSARGPHRRDVTHIIRKISGFFKNPFIFVGYRNDSFFFAHTNRYISAVFRMLCNNADAHISRLGYLWLYRNIRRKNFL